MSKFSVVRSEEEVGILKRVADLPRFKGSFKQRYSDFHVNEIGLDGAIVHLTNLEPPRERKSDIEEDDPEICKWIPEDVRNAVKDLQQKIEDAGKNAMAKSDPARKESIEIKVTELAKEERTKIHKWMANYDQLCSETIEKDGDKYIAIVFDNKNSRSRRRPAARAKFTHLVMYKEGVDTSDAIGQISKRVGIKPNFITFCGTKDKHGKTTQRISISNVDAHRLAQVSKELRSIKLGNYEYLPHHLMLGDLKGNHFKMLLRNVQAESDEAIGVAVESLKTNGFINYFGLQRFGSFEVSTHDIGKSILQNKWIEAFDLILTAKNNDPDFLKEAKREWFTNRDPNAAIEKIPRWHRSIESNLLHALSKYYSKNDFIGCFLRIPRNVRHLYVHSFQSYLWNQVASYRVEKMGLKPVPGDLVYVDKDRDEFGAEDLMEEPDEEEPSSSDPTKLKNPVRQTSEVKTLTEEDLPNYTIFDVLIPVHGTQITMPEDSHICSFYHDLLNKEGLDDDCFLTFKPVSDQPKGAYRRLLTRPRNVTHKIIPYSESDPVDTFIPSELDRLNQTMGNKSSANGAEKSGAEDANRVDNTSNKKDKKCVILEFSLPPSSYATMALREIMDLNNVETKGKSAKKHQNGESVDNGSSEVSDSKRIKLDEEVVA